MRLMFVGLVTVILAACSAHERSSAAQVVVDSPQTAASAVAPVSPQVISESLIASSAVPETVSSMQDERLLTKSASLIPSALVISTNGQLGAYIDEHGVVVVWDALKLTLLERVALPGTKARAVAISPEGDRLAIGDFSSRVVIWSRRDNKVLREFSENYGPIFALAFSPDGNMLASGAADHVTRLWDMNTGKRLREFDARNGEMVGSSSGNIVSLEFSGDGRSLAVHEFYRGQYEIGRGLTIWDVQGGFEIAARNVTPPNRDNHERSGSSVGGMGWMLVYTGREGLMVERLDDCLSTSFQLGSGGYADTVAADPQGRWAAAIEGRALTFFDVSGKAETRQVELPGGAVHMVAHPDGKSVFVVLYKQDNAGNMDSSGLIYRIKTPEQMLELPPLVAKTNMAKCSPSENARTEMVFRVPEKMPILSEVARFSVADNPRAKPTSGGIARKSNPVTFRQEIFLTADGILKALYMEQGGDSNGVAVWSMDSQQLKQSRLVERVDYLMPLHESWLGRDMQGNILNLLDGKVFAKEVTGEGQQYSILEADPDTGELYRVAGKDIEHYGANGARLKDIPKAKKGIVSLSARNGRLAILYTDYTVQILQGKSVGKSAVYGPLTKEGNCDLGGVRLSADGRYLQAGFDCGDGGDMYWMLDTLSGKWWKSHFLISGITSRANRAVVLGERQHQLAVLDFEKSKIILRLPPHRSATKGGEFNHLVAAMSNDGSLVASAAKDGTIHVWNINSGEMLGMASTGGEVSKLVFDPAAQRLAGALRNGVIVVWRLDSR